MEVKTIVTELDDCWRDTKARWKDEYSSKFQSSVINELESSLNDIEKITFKLNDAIEEALSRLDRISENCD
jgi:hypothetical protein